MPGWTRRGRFDATLEEVLHLITHAGYAHVYPEVFGEKPGTQIAKAMDQARGGHFRRVPRSYPAGAWYTYDDRSCDYGWPGHRVYLLGPDLDPGCPGLSRASAGYPGRIVAQYPGQGSAIRSGSLSLVDGSQVPVSVDSSGREIPPAAPALELIEASERSRIGGNPDWMRLPSSVVLNPGVHVPFNQEISR